MTVATSSNRASHQKVKRHQKIMKILQKPRDMQEYSLSLRRDGKRIGVVPTMGFLHAGHLSLIDVLRNQVDIVVVTIFVNPIQFGPLEDLQQYPRDFDHDRHVCEEHGVDVLFAPCPEDMYAADRSTWVEETSLSQGLCGALRPGHFRGVTTVVAKLFLLTQAEVAVFGQKDAQQALVIRRMVRDLNFPIRIIVAPLVRDADGVALSSRNNYLSPGERERARVLYRTLQFAASSLHSAKPDELETIRSAMIHKIAECADRVDYVEILDADTLKRPDGDACELLVLVAAYFGKTRLIDNVLVQLNEKEIPPCVD